MKNISDSSVIILVIITIILVFALIFSVKSPERKIIDSPILWKEDFTNISIPNIEDTYYFQYIYV